MFTDLSCIQINQVVADATNQKITDLLANADIDSLTRLVLINAVYFKASWKFAFSPKVSFKGAFASPTGTVKVTYMKRDAQVRILEAGPVNVLELPYSDQNKAMLIILPKYQTRGKRSADQMLEQVSRLDLSSVRTKGVLADTTVTIPKFIHHPVLIDGEYNHFPRYSLHLYRICPINRISIDEFVYM